MEVSKGKLKAKMLEYFREVERTGEPLIVTDHGREVLEIRPVTKPVAEPVGAGDALTRLRAQLFGDDAIAEIPDDQLLEAEWPEEIDADESWWTDSSPAQ